MKPSTVKVDPKAAAARRADGQHIDQARRPNQYQLNAAHKWRVAHGLAKANSH